MKRLVSSLSINPLIGETNLTNLPIIGITMGDPSGIGPEIILKVLSDSEIYSICRPIVLGDLGALSLDLGGLKNASINIVSKPTEAKGIPAQIDLMAISSLEKDSMIPGKPSADGGKAMVHYILEAVESFLIEKIQGILGGGQVAVHTVGHKALGIVDVGGGFPGVVGKLNFVTGCTEFGGRGSYHGVVGDAK